MKPRSALLIPLLFVALVALSSCNLSEDSESSRTPGDFDTAREKTTGVVQQGVRSNKTVGLSLALVSGDEIVWTEGFGYADKENQIPATANTVYLN